jgi:uncharacterized protein
VKVGRDPRLLPSVETEGYLTGLLVTPRLETAARVMGLWRERPAAGRQRPRIEQGLVTGLAHRKKVEANFADCLPGFAPRFCEPGQKADCDDVWLGSGDSGAQ